MPEGPEVRRTVDNLKQYEDYIIKKLQLTVEDTQKKILKNKNYYLKTFH